MSNLYTDIQLMLEQGHSPWAVAQTLEVPVSWVYEAYEQLTEDMPEPTDTTDDIIDEMAEHYGHGKEQYCEFD
jgi:hypothetical protein